MNRPDDRPTPDTDRLLAELLTDAVADVEPSDTLTALRARTRRTSSRRWVLASGGAALAAAAVVTAVALGGNPVATDDPDPVGPGPTVEPTPGPARAAAGYYLADTPAGVRLYREFRSVSAEPLDGAVDLLVTDPQDPDYRTPWQPHQLLEAHFDGIGTAGEISVIVDPSVRDRPSGMSEAEARAAVQQVIYTMQAAVEARAPVQFRTTENPIDQVLGVPTSEPLSEAPPLQTLALVNLSDPSEGETVDGDTLAVRGVASSYEANVPWELRQGDTVVDEGFFSAAGWMGQRLFPFEGEIDLSGRGPGSYTLLVRTDDPSGGAEGTGAYSDTRTIVIE